MYYSCGVVGRFEDDILIRCNYLGTLRIGEIDINFYFLRLVYFPISILARSSFVDSYGDY